MLKLFILTTLLSTPLVQANQNAIYWTVNELRRLQVEGTVFRLGLKLSPQEKKDLVHFLRHALTDLEFKKRMDNYPLR